MKKEISITKTLSEAWQIMKANWKSCLLFFTPLLILEILIQLAPLPKLPGFIVKLGIGAVYIIAINTLALKFADKKAIKFNAIFENQNLFLSVLAYNFIPIFCFLIPAVIL